MRLHTTAIFPTGEKVNPHDTASAPFGDEGLVFHVLRRGKTLRVVSGSGDEPYWQPGEVVGFHSDQSRRSLGEWTVVALADAPSRMLPLSVVK